MSIQLDVAVDAMLNAGESVLPSGYGGSYIGGATYAQLRAYAGNATRMPLYDGGIAVRRGTAADNGGTVWKDALNRSWEREFSGNVKLSWFEVDGSNTVDSTAKVIAALATGFTVEAQAGQVIKMSDGIAVDIGKQSFIGNGSILDFSPMAGTSKTAVTFVNTNTTFANDLNVPIATKHFLQGFAVLGPGKAGGGASYTGDNTKAFVNYTAHDCVRDCIFYGFGGGVHLSAGSYIQVYDRVAIGQCGLALTIDSTGSDYGERIVFSNSVIYDNKLAISNNCQTGALQFIGSSIDYNLKTLEASNSSVTELISTWLECNDAGAGNVHMSLTSGAMLTMVGGRIQQNGTPGNLAQAGFLSTSADSSASFRDVFMFNTKNGANVFDAGSGLCEIHNAKSYAVSYLPSRISATANSRLSDGGFEAATVQDLFSIVLDTAAITNRLTGSNVALSLSTEQAYSGTKSLKFQKVAGGANGAFALVVYAEPGDRVAVRFRYKKPAQVDSEAPVFVTTQGAKVNGLLPSGVPDIAASQNFDTVSIGGTAAEIDWTVMEFGMDRRVPQWGNAFVLYFNAFNFKGDFYFDDFNASVM